MVPQSYPTSLLHRLQVLDLWKDFFYGYSTLAVSDQHPPISTKYQANISPSCIMHKTLLVQHLSFMNLCNGIILIAYQALQAVMMNITTSPDCNRYLDIEKNTS
jgi:hypothetical protein